MSDCSQALALMPGHVDGSITAEQSIWLHLHLESCAECRNTLALLAETDGELLAWGKSLELPNPSAVSAHDRLVAGIDAVTARHRRTSWLPAAAVALAASLALIVIALHRTPAPAKSGDPRPSSFVGIPYLPPLDPRENATIVRMDIQVATLIAAGYSVAAEPGEVVPADVLIGEDGRARAVRMLSDIELKGAGD